MPIKKQNEGQKFYGNKLTDGNQVQKMELSQLKVFEEQPFKVNMDKEMDELVGRYILNGYVKSTICFF